MDREYMRAEPTLPGTAGSLWIDTTEAPVFPALEGVVDCDVAVVGAGLTGVLTAALLREAGASVVLLDRRRVGCAATGHTTAKVTAQHGLIYRELLDHLGEHAAVVYAEAQLTGLNLIERLVRQHALDCAFERTTFTLYAAAPGEVEAIRAEVAAEQHLGLPVAAEGPSETPFPRLASLRLDHQAQFHPLRFLLGLLEKLDAPGLAVYEQTTAHDIDDGSPCRVRCEHGEVRAQRVVIATHMPFYDRGAFFTRLYPHMAYAFAADLPRHTHPSMFYGASDGRLAVRTFPTPGDPTLVVSAGHHKTGQGGDERRPYERLAEMTRSAYGDARFTHHWSTEDFHTPDGLPFIGRSPGSKRIFLASGFGGWGMTNAAASAILIRDLVRGAENPWTDVFDPSRVRPTKSWRGFLSENLNVAKEFVGGKLGGAEPGSVEDLAPGQGAVLKHEGDKVAAVRAEDGELLLLDPTCRHLGCTVEFNEAEKTWDCPCHGSRYDAEGRPVAGPALRPLRRKG